MKQTVEVTEEIVELDGLKRKEGVRGRYAAAYRAGHQTTISVNVAPHIFLSMTPVDALAEANKIALAGHTNVIERTITVQYVADLDNPQWRVSFNLQARNSVHNGNLHIVIASSDTPLE